MSFPQTTHINLLFICNRHVVFTIISHLLVVCAETLQTGQQRALLSGITGLSLVIMQLVFCQIEPNNSKQKVFSGSIQKSPFTNVLVF